MELTKSVVCSAFELKYILISALEFTEQLVSSLVFNHHHRFDYYFYPPILLHIPLKALFHGSNYVSRLSQQIFSISKLRQ